MLKIESEQKRDSESAQKNNTKAISQESMCPFDTAKCATFRPSASLGVELKNQVGQLVDSPDWFECFDTTRFGKNHSWNVHLLQGAGVLWVKIS